jgi:sugar O-acyltransferase (sialic acid O-acetyltransferase NeuD family)
MKTLAIIGSGELGQQLAHLATSDQHYGSIVFFDDFAEIGLIDGRNIIGTTTDIEKAFAENQFDELLIGIGYKHLSVKAELVERFATQIPMGKIVHSSAWIDPTAIIEPGSVIYPGCIVDKKAVIKSGALLNLGCTVSHDSVIGQHSFLSPNVAVAGFVTIGSRCIIGINATIIDNLSIASGTQIGAGAVVIKNITEKGLYVGNPAKFIKP